jgi:hypothetical protein
VIHPASTTHFRMTDEALAARHRAGHDSPVDRPGRPGRPDRRPEARAEGGRKSGVNPAVMGPSSQRPGPTFCYTGGKPFDAAKPTVVFIHGVLNDHSVWILQTRYFATTAGTCWRWTCRAIARAAASAPKSVEEAAGLRRRAARRRRREAGRAGRPQLGLADRAGSGRAAPDRVTRLALVGTAFPMKVSQALLDNALNDPMKAIAMVNTFSHSMMAPPPSALGPGTWLYGGSHGADAARAGQQHQGQRVPPRLRRLRQLRQRRTSCGRRGRWSR